MSRQTGTSFLVQKFCRLFGRETQNVQESWKQKFRLEQILTQEEADFNQFIRLKNQLVVAVTDFSKKENLPRVQVKLLGKDMEEQLKLTHKVVEVVDRPHRKICVTMLRYNFEKSKASYVQVHYSGRRKDEEKFNQFVYVN